MVKEVIISVISVYGLKALGIATKQGIIYAKSKLGEKKYYNLVNKTRNVIADLNKLADDLGAEKTVEIIENTALDNLSKITNEPEDRIKAAIAEVLQEVEAQAVPPVENKQATEGTIIGEAKDGVVVQK